jgi:hypothetical protein
MKSQFHACCSSYPICRISAVIRQLPLCRFGIFGFAMALIVAIICPTVASAVVIGASGGPGPSTTSSFNKAGTGWFIDDGSFPAAFGRQDIAYDPTAGPWHKILAGGDGGVFTASDTDLPISVTEHLTIAGTTPWTDWHEHFSTLGWRWIDDRSGGSGEPSFTHSDGTPIAGLSIAFTDPTPTSGGKIDFTFDPLPPGTHLNITKRFVYDGLDRLLLGEVFLGKLDLFEYPTVVPEPAGLALSAAAVLGLAVATVRSRVRRGRANPCGYRC